MTMSFRYLATRLVVATALALFAGLATGNAYVAGALGGVAFVALVVVRRSGRYLETSDGAVLQRDERGRSIADRAARNGFVVLVLATAALSLASHALGRSTVSVTLVEAALALGALTWLASDLWQRRS
ncbi:MAG: hypothetical protein P8Y02_02595 [Deinococcales bacterium]